MNKFYIYLHIRKSDNIIFYVGKGKDRRAWSKQNRSKYWKNTVKKHGYDIVILANNLSENKAFDLERLMILFYGREDQGMGKLINLTDGGDGVSGRIVTEEQRKQMSSSKTKDVNQFIIDANQVHQNKYSYEGVNYINGKTKVMIFCTDHEYFPQTPSSHLRGSGCPECAIIEFKNKQTGKKVPKLSESKKGTTPWNKGNKGYTTSLKGIPKGSYSQEQIDKFIDSSHGRKISCEGNEYKSQRGASRELNISISSLKKRLKSKNFPSYFYV